ncbi:hypothetical protein HPP92_012097 [Vanilla planifolia]|uniref:Uncharacterized protein n=1 Tax=Vanilla planifolia TaxID=51239 RepID=A0A835V447_VANPL|nr:hypothetical protein HPP92_012097 [Vanilla planifolia]
MTHEEIFHRLAIQPLPEKGRFLETVMNAGPLLDTLLVAGTLPRWRNPPPLKPFLFPPMLSIRGNNLATTQSESLNPSYLLQNLDAGLKDSRPSPMRYCGAGNKQCMVAKRQKLT